MTVGTDLPPAFVTWAHASLVPLPPRRANADGADFAALDQLIGDAQVVALSEAVHGAAEPLEFRNRLFEYLVCKKGFTAIGLESGTVEGQALHDYVLGRRDDLEAALAEGISWGLDAVPQNRTLINWMRHYNAQPEHTHKIHFYGFDVPGSPGNPHVSRGVDTALGAALSYCESVDPLAAAALRHRLASLLPLLSFDFHRSESAAGYHQLPAIQRDSLTAVIVDLIALFETSESHSLSAPHRECHGRGLRAALGARQVDLWLRQIPLTWQPLDPGQALIFPSDTTAFMSAATDVRDRAQADNVAWILGQEGAGGKLLLFAHRYHISGSFITPSWTGNRVQAVMGTYLKRRLGRRLITVGNFISRGEVQDGPSTRTLAAPEDGSLEGLAEQLNVPSFWLDLRSIPPELAECLDHVRCIRGAVGTVGDVMTLRVRAAFDVLFCLDRVTPWGHLSGSDTATAAS